MSQFTFDVVLASGYTTDDSMSVDDFSTEAEAREAFEREYFAYGDAPLRVEKSLIPSDGQLDSVELDADEDGYLDTDGDGFEIQSVKKSADGTWIIVYRCQVELQLTASATSMDDAEKVLSALTKQAFLIRDLPVEKASFDSEDE
ncbi:MAG: hypothetical protein RIR29_78 [Actinomycetota bacterium]